MAKKEPAKEPAKVEAPEIEAFGHLLEMIPRGKKGLAFAWASAVEVAVRRYLLVAELVAEARRRNADGVPLSADEILQRLSAIMPLPRDIPR